MKDVIYVPTGETEGLNKARLKLVQELVDAGWTLEGKVQLMDLGLLGGVKLEVHALSRPMSI